MYRGQQEIPSLGNDRIADMKGNNIKERKMRLLRGPPSSSNQRLQSAAQIPSPTKTSDAWSESRQQPTIKETQQSDTYNARKLQPLLGSAPVSTAAPLLSNNAQDFTVTNNTQMPSSEGSPGMEVEGHGSMANHEGTAEGSGQSWHNVTEAPSLEANNNTIPGDNATPELYQDPAEYPLKNATIPGDGTNPAPTQNGPITAAPHQETGAPTPNGSQGKWTADDDDEEEEVLIEENSGPAIPEPPSHDDDLIPIDESSSTNTLKPAWDPYTKPPIPGTIPGIGSLSSLVPTPAPTHQDEVSSPQGLRGILHDHPLFYVFIFMVLSLFCFVRCKRCRRRDHDRDARGEYRAVGRMLASNFDTDVSDDEMNGEYLDSDEDDDDPAFRGTNGSGGGGDGWHNHKKGAIEMRNIGHDADLSLDEMNG